MRNAGTACRAQGAGFRDSASFRAFDACLRELWTRVAALEAPSGLQENSSWPSGLRCENSLRHDRTVVAKTTHANRSGRGNRAPVLNFVFTRVVNHYVTVVGLQGTSPDWTVRQNLLNRLRPNLNVEHEMTLGKKTNPVQYLRAIRLSLPRGRRASELGFVNHASLMFRTRFVPKRFRGPPLRRADLSQKRRGRGLACAYC